MIFGAAIDENMTDTVRITVIATGFEHTGGATRRVNRPSQLRDREGVSRTANPPRYTPATTTPEPREDSAASASTGYDPDDLELPTFLRRQR